MNYKKTTSITAIVLLALFCIFVFLSEHHAHQEAQSNIEKHGRVIADALWNFTPQGAAEYLSLACKSQNYQHLIVTDTEGKIFQQALGEDPDRGERLFRFLNLIPEKHLEAEVIYGGRVIGRIQAVWNCDTIFLEVYILLALVMIYAIFQLTTRLLKSKRDLEERVFARTRELSASNTSLQLEVENHRQARKALFKSEEQYRLIAENVADVLWVTDLNLCFTYISPSIYQQRGYTVEEAMVDDFKKMRPLGSRELIKQLYEERVRLLEENDPDAWSPISFELEQYCKDGSLIWTSNNARILKGADNQPQGILGVTRDITRQKLAEKEKARAEQHAAEQEKHALVGQIAGKMAHDFNNILGVIMGNTELALLDCRDENIQKALELIYGQTIRGKNLTKNLVAFAKDQEPKQEFFRINEKIDLVINLLRKDLEGIEIITQKARGMPDLLADPGMVEHALVNFIQNSIHALGMVQKPCITLRTYCRDENICFEIEDNGCGIPQEHLENIYKPSFTLKGAMDATGSYKKNIKGTGYGMANIKKYIEQHKGRIFVESEFGSGTKFTVRLPMAKKSGTPEEKTKISPATLHTGKHILLVEDEQAISDVQYRVLIQEPFSHKVDVAYTGEAALDLLAGNDYDFVSLDYILPGKMNGMDIYHRIRETRKKIPILFVSGNIEFLESIKDLKQKDVRIDHLSKPCQKEEYINAINKLLEKTILSGLDV